jgi:hypothetical protein
MVEIFEVPAQLVKGVWEELHTPLVSAMRYHEGMDVDDLLMLCESTHLTMLVAAVEDEIKGVVVTRLVQFPKKRMCEVVAVAGKNGQTRSWVNDGLKFLDDFAIRNGCDFIYGIGRKGWMVAKDCGYKAETRSILKKELKQWPEAVEAT